MGKGEGETEKKGQGDPHAGGKSVSEKSQATCTSKNPFEKSCSQPEYFVNALSDLLGVSTSMDVDVDSVEVELNAYTRVQQVPLDTDPLMWWK